MYAGKTLFAQIMEFVPWTSFTRIVDRYSGNAGVRRMTCAEQFRVMAFAQLTWRESLRDIEVTLGANANKLYAMGLRNAIRRSTLADANESRDWRMWSDLAALLIRRARKLYRDEDLGLDLTNTVYALDATTVDLCLSLFEWAPFRSTKAAVKLHTLSVSRFMHLFSRELGVPFRRYRIWNRLRAAMRVALTGRNLTEAAISAGFTDSAHFARLFRETFGVTPSYVFRKVARSGNIAQRVPR